jgi:hypothetical protein
MINSLYVVAATYFLALSIILYPVSPAAAISADLAKKCRDMAIKSHPPPIPPGGKAYAQAERNFFSECVSKNGEMPSPPSQSDPNSHERN